MDRTVWKGSLVFRKIFSFSFSNSRLEQKILSETTRFLVMYILIYFTDMAYQLFWNFEVALEFQKNVHVQESRERNEE